MAGCRGCHRRGGQRAAVEPFATLRARSGRRTASAALRRNDGCELCRTGPGHTAALDGDGPAFAHAVQLEGLGPMDAGPWRWAESPATVLDHGRAWWCLLRHGQHI